MSNIILDSEMKAECKNAVKKLRRQIIVEANTEIRLLNIKPYHSYLIEYGLLNSNNKNTEYNKIMVYKNRPYSFFATLTYSRNVSLEKIYQYASILIHRFDNLLFGRNYKKRSDYMTGFAFLEKHSDNSRSNDNHLHLLIKHHCVYDDHKFSVLLAKFHNAASKITDGLNRPVFSKDCIDFQEVYDDDGAIEYCFKGIWDKNLDRLKFIGVDGISDNQDDRS